MTTGEYLVANSTLSSGTALQHLLALQIGTGSGQTIFCSQSNIQLHRQETVVTRKVVRRVQAAPADAAPRRVANRNQKNVAVLQTTPTFTVFAEPLVEITVLQRSERSVSVLKAEASEATVLRYHRQG